MSTVYTYSTTRTCRVCGAVYEYDGIGYASDAICETCNAPTLVVVSFDGSNNITACRAANAFFAKHGIAPSDIKFPPAATHVGYAYDGNGCEIYTLTYHIETAAYVARQLQPWVSR